MTSYIKDTLSEKVPIIVTPNLATALIKLVRSYETYGTNIEAFTSPLLGVTSCVFRNADRDSLFELFSMSDDTVKHLIDAKTNMQTVFGVDAKDLVNQYKHDIAMRRINPISVDPARSISNSDMRKIIHHIPSINDNFQILSDPFNVFSVWVTYNILHAPRLDDKLRYKAAISMLLFLQYKFFTSLVNYRFKYKANEAVMTATYEQLSNKYYIKVYGTWKAVMEHAADLAIDPSGIHGKTWVNFDNDEKVLYIISDIQTRLRSMINIYCNEYYRIKAEGDTIGSYATMGTDAEGELKVMANESGIDMAISGVYQDCMTVTRILDYKALTLVSALFSAIRTDQLKQLLIAFSEECVKLAKVGGEDKTIYNKEKDMHLVIGGHALIMSIIQQTYRYCRNTGVNMSVPSNIIKCTKDVYTSSRISDPGINLVRESVLYYVNTLQKSTRESTVSALKAAFIIYIVILSLKYIH